MRPVLAPVGVAVFDEDGTDLWKAEVTRPAFRRDVEIKDDTTVRSLQHLVEERRLAFERDGRARLERIDLEIVDAERAVEAEQEIGVALPVRRVV